MMEQGKTKDVEKRLENIEIQHQIILTLLILVLAVSACTLIVQLFPALPGEIAKVFDQEVIGEKVTGAFYPVLSVVFNPINTFLTNIDFPLVRILVTLGLFIGTMIWVGIILKNEYVNLERPDKHIWTDLRLWTVISMLPHVVVYFYFR